MRADRLRLGGRDHVRRVELLRRAADPRLWLPRIGPRPLRAVVPTPSGSAAAAVYLPVPGFEGYSLGSDGGVCSCWVRGFVKRRRGIVGVLSDPPVWRPLRPAPNRVVRLYKGGRSFPFSVGRLLREVFPDPGEQRAPDAPPVATVPPPVPVPDAPPALAVLPPVEPDAPGSGFHPVPGFPGYVLDRTRAVWTHFAGEGALGVPSEPPVWRRVAVAIRDRGAPVVHLRRDGRTFQRSVEKLYREVFAPVPAARPEPLPARGMGIRGEPPVGSAHGRARLDEAKVAEARRLRRGGWPYADLAGRYGVSAGTVLAAVSGRTWRHVPTD
jgi:hypothetical protein